MSSSDVLIQDSINHGRVDHHIDNHRIDPSRADHRSASHIATPHFASKTSAEVRQALLNKQEIALVDVREEALFAQSHPLFAVNISLSKLEIESYNRIPRLNTPIVLYDNGEGDAWLAAQRLQQLGYQKVYLLEGNLAGWQAAGGELFQDVNVPSKSFGELVETHRQTPSLSASEVKQLLDEQADLIILDARRFDEYHTMNIPGSISVPGAELVLRSQNLAKNPTTPIIVNCAGRTRSIIGTQSLVNAGIQNPVYALRNGTIGWTLAGYALEHQQARQFSKVNESQKKQAARQATQVARKAGVKNVTLAEVQTWLADLKRTTYLFDVRTVEEYEAGHLPLSRCTPGGQLVQETDHFAAVRGARIVLIDNSDRTRANMTASWLAQMGWDSYVISDLSAAQLNQTGAWQPKTAPIPNVTDIEPAQLQQWIQQDAAHTVILDVTASSNYLKQHIPGAWFILRGQISKDIHNVPNLKQAQRIVISCGSSLLARFAATELQAHVQQPIYVLNGGNQAWQKHGYATETTAHLASRLIDRYQRPYEGTQNSSDAMQAYLDWEYGLVQQLSNDGTHGFFVI